MTKACGLGGVTRTISSPADASALASCTVVSGSIALSTGLAGNISLDGVQEITEDLSVEGVNQLVSFGARDLRRIGSTFNISNAASLSTLNFPLLTTLGGSVEWSVLPAISSLHFLANITQLQELYINDTALRSIEDLDVAIASQITISNNTRLDYIYLPVRSISYLISIESNGHSNTSVSFPQLETASNIYLNNISDIYLPTLSYVSGHVSLESSSCENFTTDSLSFIGGTFYLGANPALSNITLNSLVSVGAIDFANNTNLSTLTFDRLSRAENISVSGNLTR